MSQATNLCKRESVAHVSVHFLVAALELPLVEHHTVVGAVEVGVVQLAHLGQRRGTFVPAPDTSACLSTVAAPRHVRVLDQQVLDCSTLTDKFSGLLAYLCVLSSSRHVSPPIVEY